MGRQIAREHRRKQGTGGSGETRPARWLVEVSRPAVLGARLEVEAAAIVP
jgi:hypothetical protein